MEKTCKNCKYDDLSSREDPCHTCLVVVDHNNEHIAHTLWEPKEESDCTKCQHEPCKDCGINGQNYFEPKEVEKLCKTCGVKSIVDQMMVCTHCYDHNKWRPKEDKKMAETRKTKAQLMEELEQKNNEIAELKKELKKSESYEQCVEAGRAIRESIDGLVEGGLTEDQAMMLLVAMVPLAPKFIR